MKHIIMLLACCMCNIAFNQDCKNTLFGSVQDFHDGSLMAGATIYIEALDKYTTTDINGTFTIKNLCNGNLVLVVSHLACDTKRVTIKIDGDTNYEINLEHHIEELNEIKVNGKAPLSITQTAQETVLKEKLLERYSAYNLGDALKQVSGVSSINTGNTIVKPVINGLHSSRVLVVTNGVRLQDQEWGIEHAPNIDLNAAGSINVIKGANALAYGGDAIGGIIVLKPTAIVLNDSLFGKTITSGQTNGRGYSFTSTLTKTWEAGWYVKGQTSFKQFGDFKAADYNLSNSGLKSKGFTLNGGYNVFEKGFNVFYSYLFNEIGILRASHIGNVENLVSAIKAPRPLTIEDFSYTIKSPRQEVTHQIVKVDFYKRFKKFGRLDLQYDFQSNQRFEFDIRRGDDNKAAVDLALKTHALSAKLKLDSNYKTVYQLGANLAYQNNFADPTTGVRRLIPDYDKYDVGIFALLNFKQNNNTNFDFGLRYDFNHFNAKKFYITSRWEEQNYDTDFSDIVIGDFGTQLLTNPVFSYHNVSASAGVSHTFNKNHSVIFNYGLSNRAPNASELFSDGLHHSAARIEIGDLRVKQETSNRISGSYQFKNKGFNINLESFVNHIKDYIFIVPSGTEQTNRGAFPVWGYKQTNAMLFGIDVTARYNFSTNWFIDNKSSFIKGNDTKIKGSDSKNRDAIIDMPPFKTVNMLGYSNEKWHQFNAQLESEFVLRQNDFPDYNFNAFLPTANTTELVDISTPPPAYHLLHFQTDVTFNLSKKTKLNIGLNISNMFNTNYREYLNRLRYFADDLGRNFMLQIKLNY